MRNNPPEIPQYLWERYISYQDRISVLRGKPINDDAANKEFGLLKRHVDCIEEVYGYEEMRERYVYSVQRFIENEGKEPDASFCFLDHLDHICHHENPYSI